MHVASLHVYPVKGARGIALATAEVLTFGIRHDRRFMVLGQSGTFVTQRSHPRMALVDVGIDAPQDRLTLSAPSGRRCSVALHPEGPSRRTRVWNDDVDAVDVGGDGAAFFSEFLGEPCEFVFMPEGSVRPVEAPYGREGDRVGFADAYPVLIASLASLSDLNERLRKTNEAAIPMNRFRPNIVIGPEETIPYAEDDAATMRIGHARFRTPKPCSRCVVTTVDQATGTAGKEPLKTLARYRTVDNKVLFAVNAIPDVALGAAATIALGDPVVFD